MDAIHRRLARIADSERSRITSVAPEDLHEATGLDVRTIARMRRGLPVQRSSLRLALIGVEAVRASARAKATGT
jgi:hypothetical protein